MKFLAFAATNSVNSLNRQLVDYAASILRSTTDTDITVETIDLNDFEMPIYSVDRQDRDGFPRQALAFADKIREADALLISFAEHNGHYPTAYKNIIDWVSRLDRRIYQGKPSVLLSTSPGPSGGANVLAAAVASAPMFGTKVVGNLSVPAFHDNFDAEAATLRHTDLDAALRDSLGALITETAGIGVGASH